MAQALETKTSNSSSTAAPSDLNSACGMNRRTFFDSLRTRALDAATASVAALPLAPAAGGAMLILGIGAQESIVNSLPEQVIDEINDKNVEFSIPLEGGGVIQILGLHHTTACYERAKGYLEPRIARADIVLHELGEWFDIKIGDPARERNQMVGTIEGTFTQGKGALALIGTVSYLVIKGCQQLESGFHYATSAILGKSRETIPRRAVLTNTAKMFGALYVGVPITKIMASITGNESLIAFDVTPFSDGRTIKMLDNAFVCAQKHPGKHIVVVVGNAHADAMKFYMENPANKEIFSAKRSLYKVAHINAVDFRLGDKSTPGLL